MIKLTLNYSYLSASTGFNFDAFLAGNIPETIPDMAEKIKAPIITAGSIKIKNGIPGAKASIANLAIIAIKMPIIHPIIPPTIPKMPTQLKT